MAIVAHRLGAPLPCKDLAFELERQIRTGAFAVGEKMPSLRVVARRDGYSMNKVVAAFELLVERGLVEPRRGSGYFVRGRDRAAPSTEDAGSPVRGMNSVWLMREQLKTRPDVIALGDGFPPVDWLAEVRLSRYNHKVARTGLGALFRYGDRFGYEPLRLHLLRRLAAVGIGCEPCQILLTQGANEALDLVIRYFVTSGSPVFVDDPGYYPLFAKLKLAGANIVGVPRRENGPDTRAMAQLLAVHRPRLFFTQSLAHNPTGSDTSRTVAEAVLRLARKHNLLVVENDPFSDFKPAAAVRISALDQLERTIYVGTFSKSLSASLRVGFMAGSPDLTSELADLKAMLHVCSSEYCERTVDVILTERGYERHVETLRTRLAEATRKATRLFDLAGARIFARNEQTMYLWAQLPGVPDSLALAKDLLPEKVMLAPGSLFTVDSNAISPWSRYNVGAMQHPRAASVFRSLAAGDLARFQTAC